jgi:hypothetical protein
MVTKLFFPGFLNSLFAAGQETPLPRNYSIINMALGDLDNDGKSEHTVAYNRKNDIHE